MVYEDGFRGVGRNPCFALEQKNFVGFQELLSFIKFSSFLLSGLLTLIRPCHGLEILSFPSKLHNTCSGM